MTLFHVDLLVESRALLRARDPEPPNPAVVAKWKDADYEKELRRCDRSIHAFERLLAQSITPALRCILNAEKLNEMLEQCGGNAIIRISLEKPS